MDEVEMENDFSKIESEIRMNEYKAVKCENKYFTESDYKQLANTFQSNPVKNTLIMISIHIDSNGLKELTKFMQNNFQVKHLQISWSNFSELKQEFGDFCVALTTSNLIYLNLSNNNIDSTMASSLQYLIEKSRSLGYLDLSWNSLKSEGVRAVVEAFEGNKSKMIINLKGTGSNTNVLRQVSERLVKKQVYEKYKLSNIPDIEKLKYQPVTGKADQLSRISIMKIVEEQKILMTKKDDTITILNKRIAELGEKVKDLTQKLQLSNDTIEVLKRDFNEGLINEENNRKACEEMIKDLQDKLSKMTITKNSIISERDKLKADKEAEIHNLTKELEAKKEDYKRVQTNLSSITSNTEIIELTKKINELNKLRTEENLQLQNKHKIEIEEKTRELKNDLGQKQKKIDAQNKEINDLRKELDKKIQNDNRQKQDKEKEHDELITRLHNQHTDTLEIYKKTFEKEIERLKDQLGDSEVNKDKVLRSKKQKEKEQKEKDRKHDEELRDLEIEKNQYKVKNAELIKDNNILKEDINTLELNIKTNEATIKGLKKEIERLKNELKNDPKKIDISEYNNKMNELNAKIDERDKRIAEYRENNKRLEGKIEDLLSQIENLKSIQKRKIQELKVQLLKYIENN